MSEQSCHAGDHRPGDGRSDAHGTRARLARRAGTATVIFGAFAFFVAGAAPASAAISTGHTSADCNLGVLLCDILGGGNAKPTPPPKPSGGGTPTKPAPHPGHAVPAHVQPPGHSGSGTNPGSSGPQVPQPFAPPASGLGPATPLASPQQTSPALPDITSQDPQVLPETAPGGLTPARLVAATGLAGNTIPAPLIATASGLIGAVAAFNVSALNRRLRRPRRH